MKTYLRAFSWFISNLAKDRQWTGQFLENASARKEAFEYRTNYAEKKTNNKLNQEISDARKNPLRSYFENHRTGRGIWKCEHYFDIYHRHFSKFIGTDVNVLEIGIYSGGSLEMWQNYFGDESHIYGVDIEQACRQYESEQVSIAIGDQSDRKFWKKFKADNPAMDILIDDGGHTFEQQKITLEEMLPHLNPGGVFLCEDIVGDFNKFSAFATGLVGSLNHFVPDGGEIFQSDVNDFQRSIYSIHFYPMVVVIEKHISPFNKIIAPKHGTEWQPFFDNLERQD